jgi:membrane protease YdiL (CAAX protease family)
MAIGRALLIGTPIGIITVAGEEIGWRGYVSGRLHQAGLPAPDTIGGLIWAAWHTPLIVTGQYAAGPHALLAVLGFAMLAVGLHTLWSAWLTRTGSLWPAIVGHSAWNVVIQHPFDGHTAGASASLWLGDSGLLTAGLALAGALFLVRVRRLPNRQEMTV